MHIHIHIHIQTQYALISALVFDHGYDTHSVVFLVCTGNVR